MQIHIRQGKGRLDRYSVLSPANLDLLRLYWKRYRPKDWLFPGDRPEYPIAVCTIQGIFQRVRVKAGIKKPATVHSLRRSFATHLLEAGVGIVHIQQLLGHADLKTTSRYLYLVRMDVLKIQSPLVRAMPELQDIVHEFGPVAPLTAFGPGNELSGSARRATPSRNPAIQRSVVGFHLMATGKA